MRNKAFKNYGALSLFDKASKNPDALSFLARNALEFFWRLSFFGLEFFENVQKISLVYQQSVLCPTAIVISSHVTKKIKK